MEQNDKGDATNPSYIDDVDIYGLNNGKATQLVEFATDKLTSGGMKTEGSNNDQNGDDEEMPKTTSQAYEWILRSVGGYGLWQWRLCVIVGFCGLFHSFHNYGALFLAATPDHWCKIPTLNLDRNLAKKVVKYTVPMENDKDGELSPSKCKYYALDYSKYSSVKEFKDHFKTTQKQRVRECTEWYYDNSVYASTLVSEWDLVCKDRWLVTMTQATYTFGILVGAIIASPLSDKIGRRRVSIGSVIITFISAVGAAFSVSFGMFLGLRLITAAACQGMGLANFVLLMEVLEQRARTTVPIIGGIFWVTGACLLPIVAYYISNWRELQFIAGFATIFQLVYFWVLPESPRWLLMQGRTKEAMEILQEMAKVNKREMPPDHLIEKYFNSASNKKNKIYSGWRAELQEVGANLFSLVETPNLRRRSLTVFYGWFVVSSVYYGLTFSGYNLDLSLYELMFFMSLIGFPIIPLKIFFINRYGRRIIMAATFFICAIACFAILIVPKEMTYVNMSLVILGRAMATAAFTCVLLYSTELVPTNIRNLSIGMGSLWARVGSILSLFIVDLLGDVYYAIPSTIFGSMALLAGALSFLLPETGFSPLPESIEEIECLPK